MKPRGGCRRGHGGGILKLTFLGTGAGNFRGSRRQPSSALLEHVLLDCGAGATGRLHDLGAFDALEAVLITHLHSDHVAGVFDLLLHTIITGRTRPLTIVAPPGFGRLIDAGVAVGATVFDPRDRYDLRLVESMAPTVGVGPWTVRGVPLDHSIPNLGYHLASEGLSLFYTGDTREPSAAREQRADYLVHESTYSDVHRDLARQFGHSTATEAAEVARTIGARRLFLTHIGDFPETERDAVREARARFADSEIASDRGSFEL